MFDIGFWEIALILILALIVIGPEKLPQVARTVGHWVGRARKYIEGVKNEVEKEFDTAELKRMLHNQEVQIRELQGKMNRPLDVFNPNDINASENKNSENKIEPPAESQYEIIEEEPLPQDLPMHSHGTEKKHANSTSEAAQPESEKDKPA